MSMLKLTATVTAMFLAVACGGGNKSPASADLAGDAGAASSGSGASPMGGGGAPGAGAGAQGGSGQNSAGSQSAAGFQNAGGTIAGGGVGHAGAPPMSVAEGKPGEWVNVTPPGIKLELTDFGGMDNYGVQDVLADPARPGELYAFVCYQGLWFSKDYGTNWVQVYKGEDWGKPWGSAIDPNPKRDPTTAPTLYLGVSGALGFLKSTDFGKTWSQQKMPDSFGDYHYQEVYSVDVDPYDVKHVLVAFHEQADMAESIDGGTSWKKHETPPGDDGGSYYPFFVNTGKAETTAKTWIVIPQEASTAHAVRTVDGGANWTKLDKFQHHHGSAQLFDAGGGTVYMAAMQPSGVHKSTDFGATWQQITDMSDGVIIGTDKFLYTSVGRGWGSVSDPLDAQMGTAPRADDTNWTAMPAPKGMVDGSKRIAVTKDKSHNIVIGGNWHAGIWRYIEP